MLIKVPYKCDGDVKSMTIPFFLYDTSTPGEIEFDAGEHSYDFFDYGGTKEDLKNAIIKHVKEKNNISLVFQEYGNLYSRLFFSIDIYALIKTLK